MKKVTQSICFALLVLLLCNCTAKFEEFNSNPYEPTELNPRLLFSQLITCMSSTEENPAQRNITFWAGPFGGMLTPSSSWSRSQHFYTYNVDDSWNKWSVNWYFEKFYPNYFSIERFTNASGHYYALAKIMRVHIMQIIASMQGPLPYSKIESGQYSVGYDDEETAWKAMVSDLDYSIETLTSLMNSEPGFNQLTTEDRIYGGDYKKWIKFANSLKLRIAIRISNAAPKYAQEIAEKAVSHPYGVMTSNADDAYDNLEGTNYKNGLASVNSWGEVRANACVVSFMNGYEDPRRDAYFTKVKIANQEGFYGVRSGIRGISTSMFSNYSTVKVETKSPMLIFNASEVAFLCAEGALKKWTMGKTAKEFYEEGIRLSFAERGVSGADAYIANATRKPADYVCPTNAAYNYSNPSKVTVAWNESASDNEKLERILTQKMIANFPIGNETWADFRRTGYPAVFPAYNNLSTQGVTDERQQRRLRFSEDEYQSNEENVKEAISFLSNGQDTDATDLWWAKKN